MADLPSWACAISQTSSQWFDRNSSCYQAQNQLFDSVTADSINQKGLQLNYYPVTLDTEYDEIMKEDRAQYVERMFYIMAYTPNYPTRNRNVGLEGLINPERSTWTISKIHFAEASTYIGNESGQEEALPAPRINDLIYIRATKTLYRILQVRDTDQQFQYSQHTWTITLAQYLDNLIRIQQHPSIAPDDPILGILKDNKPFGVPLFTENETGIYEADFVPLLTDSEKEEIDTNGSEKIDDKDDELEPNILYTEETPGTSDKWLHTEEPDGLMTDDGREKVEKLWGSDIFMDQPILEKTQPQYDYTPRPMEKRAKNTPKNPFSGW